MNIAGKQNILNNRFINFSRITPTVGTLTIRYIANFSDDYGDVLCDEIMFRKKGYTSKTPEDVLDSSTHSQTPVRRRCPY